LYAKVGLRWSLTPSLEPEYTLLWIVFPQKSVLLLFRSEVQFAAEHLLDLELVLLPREQAPFPLALGSELLVFLNCR
jgi:hypothetical protein